MKIDGAQDVSDIRRGNIKFGKEFDFPTTLRDAIFAGMTLDIFNRNPEKVDMANCAQLINCLNSLFLAHEDKFCVTPVGHVFGLYADHQKGQALRTVFSAPEVHYDRAGKQASFWGLQGSASLHDKEIVLTVVNPHISEARETEIIVRDIAPKSCQVTTLTSSDIHAHNTLDQPTVVAPQRRDFEINARPLNFSFPARSVTKLSFSLD